MENRSDEETRRRNENWRKTLNESTCTTVLQSRLYFVYIVGTKLCWVCVFVCARAFIERSMELHWMMRLSFVRKLTTLLFSGSARRNLFVYKHSHRHTLKLIYNNKKVYKWMPCTNKSTTKSPPTIFCSKKFRIVSKFRQTTENVRKTETKYDLLLALCHLYSILTFHFFVFLRSKKCDWNSCVCVWMSVCFSTFFRYSVWWNLYF